MRLHHRVLFSILIVFCLKKGVNCDEDNDEINSEEIEEKWLEVYLDNFNIWNNITFFVRYFVYNKFFKPGGPLLLEIGGQMSIEPDFVLSHPSYDLTEKLNGKLVLIEHRYYGQSTPFENLNVNDLKYLSVEQALEDLALFIETYKKITPGLENSKVGVFGCSYAGTLATWLRYKFPHLVDAVWASSAPLHVTLDYSGYYEVVGQIYANVSRKCATAIEQGYKEARQLLSTPNSLKRNRAVFEDWKCGSVADLTADDILLAMRSIISNQYRTPHHTIRSCAYLEAKSVGTSYFEQLAAFIVEISEDICLSEEGLNDFVDKYQTCTEFGYSLTTSSQNQPFMDSFSAVDDLLEFCARDYGEKLTRDVVERSISRKNRLYGSTNLKVTKVFSIHGTHDPWYRLGLCQNDSEDTPVALVSGTSHCADQTKFEDEPEPPELTEKKKKGMEYMERWLMQDSAKNKNFN